VNLAEIREEAWSVARDTGTKDYDRLWTEAEMNRYINRTYRFISRETKCIRDARTPEVCRITVAPPADLATLEAQALTDAWAADDLARYNDSTSWMYHQLVAPLTYDLHKSVLDIDECKWLTQPWKLQKVSVVKWQQNPRWEQVVGYPIEYCTDYHTGKLTLNYRTTASDTLGLLVRRLPLVQLSEDADEPEFRDSYHDFFLNGVLEQMYSKQDAECIDLKKAADYRAAFKADVDEIKQQETILDQRLSVNIAMNAFR
jgi:hypothetical protein